MVNMQFPDIRAALAVSLYSIGLTSEAETNWSRLEVSFHFSSNDMPRPASLLSGLSSLQRN
jgi:hypothetical protein